MSKQQMSSWLSPEGPQGRDPYEEAIAKPDEIDRTERIETTLESVEVPELGVVGKVIFLVVLGVPVAILWLGLVAFLWRLFF